MDYLQKATEFLLYDKSCNIVSFERGINDYWGRPDVCGVTSDRKLIEIEIKDSFSDFKANFDKNIIWRYKTMPERAPHYFYFLVNENILEKVLNYTNDKHIGYGILSKDTDSHFEKIKSYKKASLNKEAKKLSIKQMAVMVQNQSRSYMDLWKNIEQRIEAKVNDRLYELNKKSA